MQYYICNRKWKSRKLKVWINNSQQLVEMQVNKYNKTNTTTKEPMKMYLIELDQVITTDT